MKRVCIALLTLPICVALTAAQVKYTTPTCPGMHVSMLNAISNNGLIVGAYFTDSDPLFHPLLIKNGKCISVGASTVLSEKFAYALGVNDNGDITGTYFDGGPFTRPTHGFLLRKDGLLTTIDFPTADDTWTFGINESGTIVGQWSVNDSSGNLLFQHGYTLKNGVFSDVVYPGYARTAVYGINARGESVGNGIDANFIGYGFTYSKGEFAAIPGMPPSAIGTAPGCINSNGNIVGQFFDQNYMVHGYLKAGSAYTTLDFPGAMWTSAQGINNSGQIVGAYWDSNWNLHGFMAEMPK